MQLQPGRIAVANRMARSVPLTCLSFLFVAMEAHVLADAINASVPCHLVLTRILDLWSDLLVVIG